MNDLGRRSRIFKLLHIVLSIGETNATYNEHCLPLAEQREITLCTYFKPAIAVPRTIRIFEGDGSLAGFVRAMKAALDAQVYDAIHAHSPHVALLFLLVAALSRPSLVRSAVMTVHDSYPNYRIRNRILLLPVFATFARIVCCSRSSLDSFPPFYKWLAGERLTAVQNGVHIARVDRIAHTCARCCEADEFNILAISRLVRIKNPFLILSAFETAADSGTRFTYIGEGPLRPSLIAACAGSALSGRVMFTGLLPRNVVFERLLAADLFVSASRGEGLPIAVLEAMACGCPVLLSDIPPHREIVGHGSYIPLVDPDDSAGFAREIRRFRAMSRSGRARIGQQCRQLVEQRFNLEAMHAGYEAIYCSVSDRLHSPLHSASGVAHAG